MVSTFQLTRSTELLPDAPDSLKLQTQILEKFAYVAGTTPQFGQLKNAFARLGYGTDGLLLEGLADQLAISSHFTDRAVDVPLPQSVQASLSKCGYIPLDSGPTDADNLGDVLPRKPLMQQPKHEHLFPNSLVGMKGPLFVNDALLLLAQLHAKPSHGAPPCVPTQSR
jgi:hypothetical protein